MDGYSDHIIVHSLGSFGFRTLEELRRLDQMVVLIVTSSDDRFLPAVKARGVPQVFHDVDDEDTLAAAGIAGARALVLVSDDDAANLRLTLTARDLRADLPIVVRMFNQDLGRQLDQVVSGVVVLSSSELAAPAFVAAALHDDWDRRFEVDGRVLLVQDALAGGSEVLLPLARIEGGETTLFPGGSGSALCLVDGGPVSTARPPQRYQTVRLRRTHEQVGDTAAALWSALTKGDRRVWGLLLLLLGLSTASMAIFHYYAGLSFVDALYFTITIISTTGFGDISVRDAAPALKFYVMTLMFLGAAGLAALYAVITDAIVGARLARAFGRPPRRLSNHVVVCGLGSIGYRVVVQLVQRGIPVVAAERQADSRFVAAARVLGVPVVTADARLEETLRALGVERARCVLACTEDDLTNLETAVKARALARAPRIVLRLFDTDLAGRVERAFDINISRSVSALAAPAFAAAALGHKVLATIPAGKRVVVLARARVLDGDGLDVARLEADVEARVLVDPPDRLPYRPALGARLPAGTPVLVAGSRRGLDEALRRLSSV